MRMRGLWIVAISAIAIAGCVPETRLQPLPDAPSPAGDPSAVIAESQGVRLIADGDAWRGSPSNLERRLTPVQVRLENQSGRPLSVRYEFFDLVGQSRFHYAALPPLELEDVSDRGPYCVASAPPWGVYGSSRWSWGWGRAPWRRPWWPSPFYDPFYDPYGPYYRPYVRCEEPLPTQDMMELALPEGTLDDGGIVSGFLYFQGIAERERQITLQARLVDAETGEPFGTLSIPFRVRT